MKRLFCLILCLILCLTSSAAMALTVPMSVSKLPDLPRAPQAPGIIRIQKDLDTIAITLDRDLPAECLVTALALDRDYCTVSINASPISEDVWEAVGLPESGQWLGFEIAWVDGDVNALARYNAAGGLDSVTRFDHDLNEYVYNDERVFVEFGDADTLVRARFDERGSLTSYGYSPRKHVIVWFDLKGNVSHGVYDDGSMRATWEADTGWYVNTPTGHVKIKLAYSPFNTEPLLPPEEEEQKPELTWYPNNTIVVAGLTLQEASKSLPDKWYNVLPIDLTRQGRQTYFLIITNIRYIGKCYVDVWGDEVTVSFDLNDHAGIELKSAYGRWFTRLSQITEKSIESTENGFVFGEPLSIANDLNGADVALLFIRSKATYTVPFRDGTELPRYWRNLVEWKEFREGLQELMPYVEK